MATSTQLAEWSSCPRCQALLEHAERSVHCPSCGLQEYANPAPTVSALIRDDRGGILLARRAVEPGAGLWDLLGGFMDEGEEPLEALRRELLEETGLEVDPGEFLGGIPDRYGDDGNCDGQPLLGLRDWAPASRSPRTTSPSSPGSRPTPFRPGPSLRSPTPSSCSTGQAPPSRR